MTRIALATVTLICLFLVAATYTQAGTAQITEERMALLEAEVDDLYAIIDEMQDNALPPVLEIPDVTAFAERALVVQALQRFPYLEFDLTCYAIRNDTLRCLRIDRIPDMPMPEWAQ
ncbi:MAG: hypothetical protein M3464_12125 [Chloroflexota bacterium]|nr:hypothetical protein [Chloroflexota bacterium]